MEDPFDLHRFLDAQEPAFSEVEEELCAGRKRTHWMWFVFPQIVGLGSSPMAQRFAIKSLAEAEAYLDHPVLGARLQTCTRLVLAVEDRTIGQIFGSPDDMKFRSSMTLFSRADPTASVFTEALEKYFGGEPDPETLKRL